MPGGGEAAHVGADFRDDHLRGQITDARDGPQQPHRDPERVEFAVHFRVDLGDGGAERIDLAQVQAQQEAMALGDPAGERGTQPLGRRFDATLDQGEQFVGVALAFDQRLEDRAAADAHDVG